MTSTQNSTHKIVLAGCGGMSRAWLNDVAERHNAEFVGLVDIIEENAKRVADEHELAVPVFTDLNKALQETKANLVFDVTIPDSHFEVVTTAMKAGCHVMGEKPMAASLSQAREIVQLSDETGKRYSVMQNRRYNKQIRDFHRMLHTGTIGEISSIHADFFIGAHFGGFREVMESPLVLDMAIHTFDQARYLTGANPVSVYCHEYNPTYSWYQGNASAICIFEMNNGVVFSYRGSWCAEGLNTSWESEWRVIGSRGSARWDGKSHAYGEVVDKSQPDAFINPIKRIDAEASWQGREGHAGCLDEMFAALEEDRPAETDCHDNIHSVAMVFGAIESARTRQKVSLV